MAHHEYENFDDLFSDLRRLIDKEIGFGFHHNSFSTTATEGLAIFVKPGDWGKAKKTLPKVFADTEKPKYDGLTLYLRVVSPDLKEKQTRLAAQKERDDKIQKERKAARPSIDNLKAKIAAAKEAAQAAKGKRKK